MIEVEFSPDFSSWRKSASHLLRTGVAPTHIYWKAGEAATVATPSSLSPLRLPRDYVQSVELASMHRSPTRWNLFYRLAWRILHGETHLMQITIDPEVQELHRMVKAVKRDLHKMHAFVRFRQDPQTGTFVAWHRPDHLILREAAPFFMRRFVMMHWTILTPDGSAHWDGRQLTYSEGVPEDPFEGKDPVESLWRDYYRSIFNPARVKVRAMKREMPTRFWPTLPESVDIPELLRQAEERTRDFLERPSSSAADFLPASSDLDSLRQASRGCRGCSIAECATQTVFGEGPSTATAMLVGEQPGDEEDRRGEPFVGPAGKILDKALAEAGWPRETLYLTNAVKHFKHTPQGPRRLHQRPSPREITACRPWLQAEVDQVRPRVLVCLGGSAAYSVFGRQSRVQEERGVFQRSALCADTLITYHPSAILRAPDETSRVARYRELVEDLRTARERSESAQI